MKLRHGFKAEAERIALEVREELDLDATEPLDPSKLAAHLAIPVVCLEDMASWGVNPRSIRRLGVEAPEEFSACTIFCGTRRLIIENRAHAATRRSNSLCHELAHAILEHEPAPVRDASGTRVWNAEMESEADWLSGVLLVPRRAALRLARQSVPVELGAATYGVSPALLEWRLNHSGVRTQVSRERARARR